MKTNCSTPRPGQPFAMRACKLAAGVCVASAITLGHTAAGAMPVGSSTRLSVASGGVEASGASYHGHMSFNGRYAVFSSDATDLVPGDTNGMTDVFWHDRHTQETRRVSVSTEGGQGDDRSLAGGVSGNGRLVVFWSSASNLAAADDNDRHDIFLHDVPSGTTTRVNLGLQRTEANGVSRWPTISDDGRWIAYNSFASNLVGGDNNGASDIFLYEVKTGTTTRVGQPAGTESDSDSGVPRLSRRGRWVSFESRATNLVPSDTNGVMDAFLLDRKDGSVTRISVSSGGDQGDAQSRLPVISARGRYVAFHSLATNLVPDDTNGAHDAFVYDRKTGETERVSVASDGAQGMMASFAGGISSNGRYVVMTSHATEFMAGDTNDSPDVFVRDRKLGTTIHLSRSPDGVPGDGASSGDAMSRNGRYVLVQSDASNIVSDDANGEPDVFLHRWR